MNTYRIYTDGMVENVQENPDPTRNDDYLVTNADTPEQALENAKDGGWI